jgi:protein-S-isoprenylcysteine O-methyltransferase Ste14
MNDKISPTMKIKNETVLKIESIIALGIAVVGVLYLFEVQYIFSTNPITILIQIVSISFMIWARYTFGFRSFHATANATKGKLITTGPYHFLRHPIYAALIYFFWASVISYPYLETIIAVFCITAGLFIRMILEEKFLMIAYDDYAAYAKRTKRIIPFLF